MTTQQPTDGIQNQSVNAETAASTLHGAKKLSSRDLFAAAKAVMIEHAGDIYVLRVTKQNKLILTK